MIPHASKHLSVWLAEAKYLSRSGANVLSWANTAGARPMTTQGTNYPQYDGSTVYVDDEAMELTPADAVTPARIFLKLAPLAANNLDTIFWCGNQFSFRRASNTSYRAAPGETNIDDFGHGGGRCWVNKAATNNFSGKHVVSVENGSTVRQFLGLRSHFGTRHPRCRYTAIIATSAVTDQEGDDITDWLIAYEPSQSPLARIIQAHHAALNGGPL